METDEVFINILRENMLHLRHQETQRMWFANIFSAIFAGLLAYVSREGLGEIQLPIPLALLIISIICLLVTLKLNKVFQDYKDATENILDRHKLPLGLGAGEQWKDYTGLYTSDKHPFWGRLKVRCLCLVLYSAGIVFSVILLCSPSILLNLSCQSP